MASLHLPQVSPHQRPRTGRSNLLDPQMRMFTVTSPSLQMRATASGMFLPLIQRYPPVACAGQGCTNAFTRLRNPEILAHLDVSTVWKGLSNAQSKELAYWASAFQKSLKEMVFEGLRAQQGGALILQSPYHSCSSTECTSSFAAKNIRVNINDLVTRMCNVYKNEKPGITSYEPEVLFSSAERFVDTCDCFFDASPNDVRVQQILSAFRVNELDPSVSVWFPGERLDFFSQSPRLCQAEVVPQLDRIEFVNLEPMVLEGSDFQLRPCIKWSRKTPEKERLSAMAVFTLGPHMEWLHWDDESASFRGEMQYFCFSSEAALRDYWGSAIIVHDCENDSLYASLVTLCITVKATITGHCSQGASFERVLRSRVSIKVALPRCTIGQQLSDHGNSDDDDYWSSDAGFHDEGWDGSGDEQARQASSSSTLTGSDPGPTAGQSSEAVEHLLDQAVEASFEIPVYQFSPSLRATTPDDEASQLARDFLDEAWEEPIDEQVKQMLRSATSAVSERKVSKARATGSKTTFGLADNDMARQVSWSSTSTATDREPNTLQLGRFKTGMQCRNPENMARQPTRQPTGPPSDLEVQKEAGFSETKNSGTPRKFTNRKLQKSLLRHLRKNAKPEVKSPADTPSSSDSEDQEGRPGPAHPSPRVTSESANDNDSAIAMSSCSSSVHSESSSPIDGRTHAQVVFDLYQETEMRESSNLFAHMAISVLIEAEKQRWRDWRARWAMMAPADSVTEGIRTPDSGSEFDFGSSSEAVSWGPGC